MKQIFTPSDFSSLNIVNVATREITLTRETAAALANAKIQKLINEAPVVYSYDGIDDWFKPTEQDYPNVRFKARLMFIEPIKKECVKHEPVSFQDHEGELAFNPICKHCGIMIEAVWNEKVGGLDG